MGPDWPKLFSEGRAKALNVPFSDEDWALIKAEKKTPKEIQEEYARESAKVVIGRNPSGEEFDVTKLPNKGAVIELITQKLRDSGVELSDELSGKIGTMNRSDLDEFYNNEDNFKKPE